MSPPKQGDALDPLLGFAKAWWVDYPRIFIFVPPPDQRNSEAKLPTGGSAVGINAVELAKAFTAAGPLDQNASDVVMNNQIGSLTVREQAGAITPGATSAIDFVFSGPFGSEVIVPVKFAPIGGRA
jgi:hypothetical protein